MNENKPVKHGALWTVLFAVVSLFWIFPIVLVLINSFKQKAYISKNAFSLPAGKAFVGLENYVRGIETTQFFASFGWTLLITVGSVVLILVCTSMCAWWIVKPSIVSVAILEAMWIWNDYLLPYLTLDLGKYKTVSVAVQYLKGGYGSVDMGAMMACLVLAIIPIIVFYLVCQKYIVSGVMAGAVKG